MEARVVMGIIGLIALSLAGVMIASARVATRTALERAASSLEDARSALYSLVTHQADIAAMNTRLITSMPTFRAIIQNPVVSADYQTVTNAADEFRRNLGAEFTVITTPDGHPITHPGLTVDAIPADLQRLIDGAARGTSGKDVLTIGNRLYLVTSEPAKFDQEVLATVTFGFALDDRVATQLSQATNSEINLVAANTLAGSSLPPADQREVSAALGGGLLAQDGVSPQRWAIGSRRFIAGTFPLTPNGPVGGARLVLLQDWAPTQRFLDELTRSLLLAGLAAFALTLIAGWLFSRRTSQPLMDMAAAAGRVAAGDWSQQVPIRGSAEAEALADAFNNMTSSLREQSERLKSSYERFSTVTQSARDAIVSADQQGRITFWNRSAEHTFGYAESEVLGRPLTMLMPEADRAAYTAALPEPTGDGLAFGHTIEVTGVRKDGGQFPAEFSLATSRGTDGLTLTAVIRDVTERRLVQDALRQRDEQLRQSQKMEAIGRLAGGVAHDFNNLLMAIRGYSEMLIQSFSEGDDRKNDTQEILNAADRAAGLTGQLLAFSRRQVITQQALALDQIVDSLQKMLQRLIGEDIQLVTHVWPGLAPVLGDRTQMEQILVNLIVNARDAMPNGGRITIELRNIELDTIGVAAHPGLQPGAYVEMAVTDTGTGMDADTASRIFEPFFTTKEGGKGTGLGLATVYGIVQQSNGAIEVQSRVGHGTTFFIYLPRATDFGKAVDVKEEVKSTGSETVLLVEDDDRVRVLVSSMLRKNGYTVLLASAGDQALEIAQRYQGSIDLLLTDVVMPGMSGRVLSERLIFARPDTRVLYMSGYSDDAILRHGVKSAGAHFIQKPFSIDALADKVREALSDLRER